MAPGWMLYGLSGEKVLVNYSNMGTESKKEKLNRQLDQEFRDRGGDRPNPSRDLMVLKILLSSSGKL